MSLDFGGSRDKTKGNSTTTTSISQEGLDYLLKNILEEEEGLSSVFSAEQQSGLYNSSTNQQLAGNLISRAAGEVAARNTTVTQTQRSTKKSGGLKLGTVLCTHYMLTREMNPADHAVSARRSSDIMTAAHMRGYHYWAIPAVTWLRTGSRLSKLADRYIFKPIIFNWVALLNDKPKNFMMYVNLWLILPLCYVLGKTVARETQEWEKLYRVAKEN